MDLISSIWVLYKDFVHEYYFTSWITICLLLIFGLSVCVAVTSDNKESLCDNSDVLGVIGSVCAALLVGWWAFLPIAIVVLTFYGTVFMCSWIASNLVLFIQNSSGGQLNIFRKKDKT